MRLGGRDQARRVADALPPDLDDSEVVVDCSRLEVSTPSFVDELLKVLLLDRGALRVRFVSAPERLAEYVRRAAVARSIESQVLVEEPLRPGV